MGPPPIYPHRGYHRRGALRGYNLALGRANRSQGRDAFLDLRRTALGLRSWLLTTAVVAAVGGFISQDMGPNFNEGMATVLGASLFLGLPVPHIGGIRLSPVASRRIPPSQRSGTLTRPRARPLPCGCRTASAPSRAPPARRRARTARPASRLRIEGPGQGDASLARGARAENPAGHRPGDFEAPPPRKSAHRA